MMMATTLRHLDQLLHTVERGRALNVDNEGRLPVRLYGPDGQPLFTEQNPAHVKGEVTLTGQIVDSDENAVRVKTSALAWKSWDPFGATVFVPAGTFIDSPGDVMQVNGFGTLALMLRRVGETRVGQASLDVYWQSIPGRRSNDRATPERFEVTSEQAPDVIGLALAIPTKSQYVGFRLYNRSETDATYHLHAMLRAS